MKYSIIYQWQNAAFFRKWLCWACLKSAVFHHLQTSVVNCLSSRARSSSTSSSLPGLCHHSLVRGFSSCSYSYMMLL